MRGAHRRSRRRPQAGAVAALAALLLVGLNAVVWARVTAASFTGSAEPAPAQAIDAQLVAMPSPTEVPEADLLEPPPATTTPPPTTAAPPETTAPPAVAPVAPPPTAPTGPLKVLFVGDSVAKTAASSLVPVAGGHRVVIANEGRLGCGITRAVPFRYFGQRYDSVPPGCESWPTWWRDAALRHRPDVVVVLVGRWELMDRVVGGRWAHIGQPAFDAEVARELDTALAAAGASGAKVVLATTPYYLRGLRPDGGRWPEDDPARVDRVNQLFREAAARRPGVAVVDLGAHLSPGGQLQNEVGGVRLRTDGVHIAPEAGTYIGPWLLPQLRQLLAR